MTGKDEIAALPLHFDSFPPPRGKGRMGGYLEMTNSIKAGFSIGVENDRIKAPSFNPSTSSG